MEERQTKTDLEDFKCSICSKECDNLWMFTGYGNESRQQEAAKNNEHCKSCFDEIDKNL